MENKCKTDHDDDCKECIHHWLIDARNFGVCRKCGDSKQFCSWPEAAIYQRARGIVLWALKLTDVAINIMTRTY